VGREVTCNARIGRDRVCVNVHLDATSVRISGDVKLTIPFAAMRDVTVRDGALRFRSAERALALELGAKEAERWAKDILHPKSRLEKLGVKRDARVAAIGISDKKFLGELGEALDLPPARTARGRYDLVFRELGAKRDLDQIAKLRARLEPDGALWLIYSKGKGAPLTERAVRDAFLAAGLVDTKVVSFSPTHTAVKLVNPHRARALLRPGGKESGGGRNVGP